MVAGGAGWSLVEATPARRSAPPWGAARQAGRPGREVLGGRRWRGAGRGGDARGARLRQGLSRLVARGARSGPRDGRRRVLRGPGACPGAGPSMGARRPLYGPGARCVAWGTSGEIRARRGWLGQVVDHGGGVATLTVTRAPKPPGTASPRGKWRSCDPTRSRGNPTIQATTLTTGAKRLPRRLSVQCRPLDASQRSTTMQGWQRRPLLLNNPPRVRPAKRSHRSVCKACLT